MAVTAPLTSAPAPRPLPHANRTRLLATIVAFTLASTALHYSHNYLQIEHYPPADFATNHTIQIAILISWPALTVAGLLGFWLYTRGLMPSAYACLITYSALGLVTLGHFTEGSPQIPPFWYATIFTDAVGGLAILAFVAWSVLAPEHANARH